MQAPAGIEQAISHSDPIAPVIFGVTLIVVAAFLGRFFARHLGQPSVLGELLMGVLLGNLLYFFHYDLMVVLREGTAAMDIARHALSGASWDEAAILVLGKELGPSFLEIARGPYGNDYYQVAQAVDTFSRYGVIFLLFHVGLDTRLSELKEVGGDSLRVAVIGVAAPFALGFAMAWVLMPEAEHAQHMFLGATLGATSIGITARVLNDINKAATKEAHVILGAAVMDDIMGLIVLAIVSGIVVTGSVEVTEISRTILLSLLFISSVFLLGPNILKLQTRLLSNLDVLEAKLFISFIFVMVLAWLATAVGLATIIGAFAAGVIMHDSYFNAWGDHHRHKYSIKELFAPIEAILVPVFFVLMGLQVKLETFMHWEVITLAIGLLVVATIGKLVAGFGAGTKLNRAAIGIGMLPRGEVGLVFASIGKSLGVVDSAMFSAIVLMVIITTLITPPILTLSLEKMSHH